MTLKKYYIIVERDWVDEFNKGDAVGQAWSEAWGAMLEKLFAQYPGEWLAFVYSRSIKEKWPGENPPIAHSVDYRKLHEECQGKLATGEYLYVVGP